MVTGNLHQATSSTDCASPCMHVARWSAAIGGFSISTAPGELLPQTSVAVSVSCCWVSCLGHPCYWNVSSAIPVDVVVLYYAISFLVLPCAPVRVSINKLYLVTKQIVAGLLGVCLKLRKIGLRGILILLSYCVRAFPKLGIK